MVVHLTTHSAYSLGEGLALPEELVEAAVAQKMPYLGLTDHRLLTGTVEFVKACGRAGIQPLLGLEIDLEAGSLTLMAMDLSGWSNLCRLSSAMALGPDPEAPCSMDLLAEHTAGLLALIETSNHPNSEILGQLSALFPKCLYLTLHDPAKSLPVADLGRRFSLPLVVSHPIFYIHPDQHSLQATLSAIRLNKTLNQLPRGATATSNAYFMSSGEIERRFHGLHAALLATQEIAERCSFQLPLDVPHLPEIPLPAGSSASQYLKQKAEEGARRIYGSITPTIRERLDHEFQVISRLGFEPIFLIVKELLDYARLNGIPFSSRGSAASSLVAHCLGITSPDPIRLNLYFERFLNPARSSPPDIDTDLCSRQRDAIINHAFDVFGVDRVAMVATINHFRPRSALGEVARAHGLAVAQVRELTESLPHSFFARMTDGEEGSTTPLTSPYADLKKRYTSPTLRRVFDDADALLRLPRHLSVHPGGLVVAPSCIMDLVPVMRSGSKGVIITQFDLHAVEEFGLVKVDLLGIRGLTVLGDVAEYIHQESPGKYTNRLEVLDSTPTNDSATADVVEHGTTIGCFQIESPGMRSTLREIRARTEDDLIIALALYRPGPLGGGLKDVFVRRFKGLEEVTHIHPAMAPILDETLGVILYQEQVLRIAHDLAGFSLAESDLLRRAMSHFDPGRQLQQLEDKFVHQVGEKSGIPTATGERVWEMMAAFAGYGYPKAHAASYARVAWRSAWCKTHFPAEFMAAVLANQGGYYSQRVYLNEARRLGLMIRPPHINHSGRSFTSVLLGDQKVLYMGLDQVYSLTNRTIKRIIKERPYDSLEDFLTRVDPQPQEAMNLTKVGALDTLGQIPSMLRRIEKGGWQARQPGLFDFRSAEKRTEGSVEEDWTSDQKGAAQQDLLGANLEIHPLERAASKIAVTGAVTTLEASACTGQQVTVVGIRQSSHRSRTSKGETILFLTMEDLAGTLDVVLYPNVYQRVRGFIHTFDPLLVTGVVSMDPARNEPLLRAEKVEKL